MAISSTAIGRLAWRNVVRNWRRSLATSLAITAGFTAISLFDGFLADLRFVQEDGFSSRGMLGDLIIQKKDAQHYLVEDTWKYALTKSDQEFIDSYVKQNEDILRRVRMLEVKGMISNGENNAIFIGSSHDIAEGLELRAPLWQWNAVTGKPLHLVESDEYLLMGLGLGAMMGCTPTVDVTNVLRRGGGYVSEERPFKCGKSTMQLSVTTEAAQVNALDLGVAGLMDQGFRQGDMHWVMLPLSTAQRLLDTDKVTVITLKLHSGKDPKKTMDDLKQKTKAAGLDFDIMPWRDHTIGNFMRNTQQILNTFRLIFMTIVVTIVVLSVANTMMKSVNERIREIGTLRSFGFRRSDIQRVFTAEGLFLAVLSCLGGVVATLLMSFLINHSGIRYSGGMLSVPVFMTVGLNPMIWISNSLWLGALAAASAWFSSRRASQMVVADALRSL
jgi:putative ABC transport system permease protein